MKKILIIAFFCLPHHLLDKASEQVQIASTSHHIYVHIIIFSAFTVNEESHRTQIKLLAVVKILNFVGVCMYVHLLVISPYQKVLLHTQAAISFN